MEQVVRRNASIEFDAMYTAGLDAAGLRADRRTVDAVVRNLEVLGEAAKRVSNTLRARAPGVPWREIGPLPHLLTS